MSTEFFHKLFFEYKLVLLCIIFNSVMKKTHELMVHPSKQKKRSEIHRSKSGIFAAAFWCAVNSELCQ
jgi:hypothetical protein